MKESNLVRIVARASPWLAPVPSAFFVGRSAMANLALPWPVALVAAVIVECLGLTTVHTALTFADYNAAKRKADPAAPTGLAVALGGVYVLTTLSLIVALEVWPTLATFAPALFPFLAVVGAVNLVLMARHDRRLQAIAQDKAERRAERQAQRAAKRSGSPNLTAAASDRSEAIRVTGQIDRSVVGSDRAILTADPDRSTEPGNSARRAGKEQAILDLLAFLASNPGASYREAGEAVNRSKPWAVGAVAELQAAGQLRKNGHGWEVLEVGR